jgi:hypothetical protein
MPSFAAAHSPASCCGAISFEFQVLIERELRLVGLLAVVKVVIPVSPCGRIDNLCSFRFMRPAKPWRALNSS